MAGPLTNQNSVGMSMTSHQNFSEPGSNLSSRTVALNSEPSSLSCSQILLFFFLLNSTISRTSSLKDVVDAIVSPLPPKKERQPLLTRKIFCTYLPSFPTYWRPFAYCPVSQDLNTVLRATGGRGGMTASHGEDAAPDPSQATTKETYFKLFCVVGFGPLCH